MEPSQNVTVIEEPGRTIYLVGTAHVSRQSVDEVRRRYGKHTLFLGSSFLANKFAEHLGERGDIPKRKETLLKGETPRKRLGIPMFLADVK